MLTEINDMNKVTNVNYAEIVAAINGTANSAINYTQKIPNNNSHNTLILLKNL